MPLNQIAAIDTLLAKRKIIITCGTGGVGKTTLSAALALRAATLGKHVVVITIDPAKRLTTSLGIANIGNEPKDITQNLAQVWGAPVLGTIHALMPDTSKTFEDFVRELAPDPIVANRVMSNPIYEIFTREFSGTNEYMALERLYMLNLDSRFDCIILDTPPSRNTVHFLKAPQLLARFFEERLIRWLVLPTNKIVSAAMKTALGLLERLTGAGFMTHLIEFASSLFEVQARFVKNLHKIMALLKSDAVGFVLVAAPAPDLVVELNQFAQTLHAQDMHLDGLLLNRSLAQLEVGTTPTQVEGHPDWERAVAVLEAMRLRESRALVELEKTGVPMLCCVPELARDVHSVEDLAHVARALV